MYRLCALLIAAVLVAGCGSDGRTAGGAESTAGSPAPSSGDLPFGTVPAVDGGTLDGAELAGQDLALWFWAPW